jgi:hypothetical protein
MVDANPAIIALLNKLRSRRGILRPQKLEDLRFQLRSTPLDVFKATLRIVDGDDIRFLYEAGLGMEQQRAAVAEVDRRAKES